jgi:hypothetical protein
LGRKGRGKKEGEELVKKALKNAIDEKGRNSLQLLKRWKGFISMTYL